MKNRVLITGAALAQSLVLAALTLNPGAASATPYGPNIPTSIPGDCEEADPVTSGSGAYVISGQVSYSATASAWCKFIATEGTAGLSLTLTEQITWGDTSNDWTDWHEEIATNTGWAFYLSGQYQQTYDVFFTSPQTSHTFEKTLVCQSATGTACGNVYIYEWPTVEPHNPIPEPGTLLLLGAGLVGIAGRRFARR